ncbi:MAG: TRAP-type C4-dicarboxylate transport system substrate-binding protein [bacterium]|jgi:TRAP-type C4-dicarboxylate transport system substrate-binding protein
MKSRNFILCFLLLFCFFLVPTTHAKRVRIKLGTFAPESTFWVKELKKMGSQWKKITRRSKNKVTLKIYAGNIAGDEPTMIRKLNAKQLSAAILTVLGLSEIVPEIMVFNTPLLFRSDAEVEYVLKKIRPELEAKFEAKGYKVLNWANLGWVHLFTKRKVTTPKQLEKFKLFVGTPEGSAVYKKAKFRTVDIDNTDVLSALNTGLVTSFNSAPLYALAFQWFALAPNMMDYRWAPALGATIISIDKWNDIESKHHKELFQLSTDWGIKAAQKIKEFDVIAIKEMQKNGLKIHKLTQKQKNAWKKRFKGVHPFMRQKVSPKFFDKVLRLLKEYRQR